jgi:hypothetical protein
VIVDLPPDFKELLAEFAREAADVVIVGGYAVAFHARPRATKDLDLVVEGSAENVARTTRVLARFGAPSVVVEGVRKQTATEIVYMGQPPLRVDFLRTIDGVDAPGLFARAVAAQVDDVPVRVISLDDLIANKRAAGRPQDLIDVALLERLRARTPEK